MQKIDSPKLGGLANGGPERTRDIKKTKKKKNIEKNFIMEQLLKVEIVEDDCKCCLKTLDSLLFEQIIVTLQLKEVFQELLSDEVNIFDLFTSQNIE